MAFVEDPAYYPNPGYDPAVDEPIPDLFLDGVVVEYAPWSSAGPVLASSFGGVVSRENPQVIKTFWGDGDYPALECAGFKPLGTPDCRFYEFGDWINSQFAPFPFGPLRHPASFYATFYSDSHAGATCS